MGVTNTSDDYTDNLHDLHITNTSIIGRMLSIGSDGETQSMEQYGPDLLVTHYKVISPSHALCETGGGAGGGKAGRSRSEERNLDQQTVLTVIRDGRCSVYRRHITDVDDDARQRRRTRQRISNPEKDIASSSCLYS